MFSSVNKKIMFYYKITLKIQLPTNNESLNFFDENNWDCIVERLPDWFFNRSF